MHCHGGRQTVKSTGPPHPSPMTANKPNLDEKPPVNNAKTANTQSEPAEFTFPLWPEDVLRVPKTLLRRVLFTASQERAIHKDLTLVFAGDGIEISVQGERLNQQDLDLFEKLLQARCDKTPDAPVYFSANSVVRSLKRETGGEDHEEFMNDVGRLMGSAIEIRWMAEKKKFISCLVSSANINHAKGEWAVQFGQEFITFYGQGYTSDELQERLALGRNNTAKWLHQFYAGHIKSFAHSVDSLWKLSGSTAKRDGFRRSLNAALVKLMNLRAIEDFQIDADDLVHVQRKSSLNQQQRLNTKESNGKGLHKIG